MTELNILICSAGRRPYLVEWFAEALALNSVKGSVVVADADPTAASRSFAGSFVPAPRLDSPQYETWFTDTVGEHDIGLAISINDHELSLWAKRDFNSLSRATAIHLSAHMQDLVEDKALMARRLTDAGILTPPTATGADVIAQPATVAAWGDRFIIKHRFGSGSVGLAHANSSNLRQTLESSATAVLDRLGRRIDDPGRALEALVVQPFLEGVEFGVDIISSFDGAYAAALARQKLVMRAGETDRAISADATPLAPTAELVTAAVPHRGTMDGDIMVTPDNQAWVIDLNPRFGGGYPFSHVAGANVPAAYLAWALGRQPEPEWFMPRAGVTGAKYVGITSVGDTL